MDICNTKLKIMSNLIFSLGCEFNDSKTIKLHIICILRKKAIADFSFFFSSLLRVNFTVEQNKSTLSDSSVCRARFLQPELEESDSQTQKKSKKDVS